jgi:hypothetical protein
LFCLTACDKFGCSNGRLVLEDTGEWINSDESLKKQRGRWQPLLIISNAMLIPLILTHFFIRIYEYILNGLGMVFRQLN